MQSCHFHRTSAAPLRDILAGDVCSPDSLFSYLQRIRPMPPQSVSPGFVGWLLGNSGGISMLHSAPSALTIPTVLRMFHYTDGFYINFIIFSFIFTVHFNSSESFYSFIKTPRGLRILLYRKPPGLLQCTSIVNQTIFSFQNSALFYFNTLLTANQ